MYKYSLAIHLYTVCEQTNNNLNWSEFASQQRHVDFEKVTFLTWGGSQSEIRQQSREYKALNKETTMTDLNVWFYRHIFTRSANSYTVRLNISLRNWCNTYSLVYSLSSHFLSSLVAASCICRMLQMCQQPPLQDQDVPSTPVTPVISLPVISSMKMSVRPSAVVSSAAIWSLSPRRLSTVHQPPGPIRHHPHAGPHHTRHDL